MQTTLTLWQPNKAHIAREQISQLKDMQSTIHFEWFAKSLMGHIWWNQTNEWHMNLANTYVSMSWGISSKSSNVLWLASKVWFIFLFSKISSPDSTNSVHPDVSFGISLICKQIKHHHPQRPWPYWSKLDFLIRINEKVNFWCKQLSTNRWCRSKRSKQQFSVFEMRNQST